MSTTASPGWKSSVRSGGGRRPGGAWRTAALLAASILFALALCEAGLRLFNRIESHRASAHAGEPVMAPIAAAAAMKYVEQLPAALGTDRRWFLDDPPPLPNRAAVAPERLERYKDFERRGIFTPRADYIWNRYYVESQRCAPNGFFERFPDSVLAFSPPSASSHPRYRFPPNATLGSGLVTNEFGLRGPPLTLSKPPRTIRIAFAGASTTVGFHHFPFSYPERVVYWLNRYAETNRLDVRFEALNGGREGINSEDIAPIVRDELLPLDPDIVVYYEGSNQFYSATNLVTPHIPARQDLDPRDTVIEHRVPEVLRAHLATADLLDRALSGFGTLAEPSKPAYRLDWPTVVDEQKPDVNSSHLPLQLPTVIRDLDSIRDAIEASGRTLVLCSFEWMVKGGMRLSPQRHEFIYKQLNTSLWPLRYADIRRLADFQNRVFRRYAGDRKIPFLDVAAALPQDPDLFSDAIHMTDTGERVKAWIFFQQLLPIVRGKIDSGQLPRAAGSHPLPPPPSLAAAETTVRCAGETSGPLERIEGGLSLNNIDLAYEGAKIEPGPPVRVATAALPWSFAATIPINAPAGLARPCYLFLRARVVKGQIGLGVADLGNAAFQAEKAVSPSANSTDIFVPVLFPERAVALVIRNVAPAGVASEILIDDAALMAFLKPLPTELVKSIDLRHIHAEGPGSAAVRTAPGLQLTTPAGQGAFAGRISLDLGNTNGAAPRVHVWMRTLDGKVGIGILNPDGKTFLVERFVHPAPKTSEIILPLPSPPLTGDLIFRNVAAGNVVSKAIIEKLEIRQAP